MKALVTQIWLSVLGLFLFAHSFPARITGSDTLNKVKANTCPGQSLYDTSCYKQTWI